MKIEQRGRVFHFLDEETGIHIHVSRIREQHNGDWRGLVDIRNGDCQIHKSMVNLSITTGRNSLIKFLPDNQRWKPLIEEMSTYILDALVQGDQMVEIASCEPIESVQYLLEPLLPMNQPTILFGKKGCCKSYLADMVALLVQLPWQDNPLHWKPIKTPANVLYLDWETDRPTLHQRIKRLVRGMDLPDLTINYRRCTHRLIDDIEAIHSLIMETNCLLVIVDSAGRACGGDLKDAAVVNDFFAAIRELNITALIIHHTAKDEFSKRKTPFGSVYFENNARSVWEIQREQQPGENQIILSLANIEANESARHEAIGLQVSFDNEFLKTRFTLCALEGTTLGDKLPLWQRIKEALLDGSMSEDDIADCIGEKKSSVRVILYRHDRVFTRVGKGQWGVITDEL